MNNSWCCCADAAYAHLPKSFHPRESLLTPIHKEENIAERWTIYFFLHVKTRRRVYFCALSSGWCPRQSVFPFCVHAFQRFASESGKFAHSVDYWESSFANSSCVWFDEVFLCGQFATCRRHSHEMHPSKQRLSFFFFYSLSLPNTLARRDHYYALRECANGTPLIVSIYEPLHVSLRPFNAKSINSLAACKQKILIWMRVVILAPLRSFSTVYRSAKLFRVWIMHTMYRQLFYGRAYYYTRVIIPKVWLRIICRWVG